MKELDMPHNSQGKNPLRDNDFRDKLTCFGNVNKNLKAILITFFHERKKNKTKLLK